MLAAATATGSFASAAGTRADYVERVEPICKAANTANAGVLQGVKDEVARGHLKQAAPAVLRAARGLERVIGRLAPVPRPPADSRRLTRWLGYAKNGDRLLWKMGRSLRAERKGSVQAMANELVREAKRANAVVVGFDFDYCRLNPARFV